MQIPMKTHWDYNSTNILIAVGKPRRETNEDCVVRNGKILNKGNNDSNLSAGVLYNLITFQAGLTLISLFESNKRPCRPYSHCKLKDESM